MELAKPQNLLLLWVIPALVFFFAYSFKKKEQALDRFCGLGMVEKLAPDFSRTKRNLKAFLCLSAFFFLAVALAQPRWGFQWEEVKREGVDIIIAFDVSESMLASDIKPSRLERAKRKVGDLLNMLEGDRVGLVAFAGVSFLECPLTLDYGAVSMFLDYLDPDLIPVQGTAIGEAVRTSVKAFGSFRGKDRALILITDGEDLGGDAIKEAEAAREAGVKIFAIGVGSEGGAPIPVRGSKGGFKKDKKGNLIISRLDESVLEKMVIETNGVYARSVTGDIDLEKIYRENIRSTMERGEFKSGRKKRWEERFQLFVFFGLILIALKSFLTFGMVKKI